ncbi:hypothetical protein BVX93_01850 [bacterium B13(2017)]|nr:hypothetical protein BVX93_01850 [bacterium B13(2017)]
MTKIELPFCPKCELTYPSENNFCPKDGAQLIFPKDDPLVGNVLNDRYRIIQKVGEGGMGSVYKARQLSTDKIVAIKLILPSLTSDEKNVQRFMREVKVQSMLGHPNIVTLFDFCETSDRRYYFVMDFVEGKSLNEMLYDKGPLPLNNFYELACQICNGLEYAHSKGIIHRDIKSENIFIVPLNRQKIVKILDFGLAKVFDLTKEDSLALSTTGMPLGTPNYISPEQAKGELDKIGPWSDIYSLGIIFYQMLTGKLPFESSTPLGMIHKHIYDAPPPLRKIVPSLPKALESIILKCLAKNPGKRYNSVFNIENDLFYIIPELQLNPEQERVIREIAITKKIKIKSSKKIPKSLISITWLIIFLFTGLSFWFLKTYSELIFSNYFNNNKLYINLNDKPIIKSFKYPTPRREIGTHFYNYKIPYSDTGNIFIKTIPQRAQIWYKKRYLGLTPKEFGPFLPGKKSFEIKKNGFNSKIININIEAKKTIRPPSIKLRSFMGNIFINIKMSYKDVHIPIEGKIKIGNTDWKQIDLPWLEENLLCHEYIIKLKIKGYEIIDPKIQSVSVINNKTRNITFYLKPNHDEFYIPGRMYFGKRKYKEALQEFKKAIEVNPKIDEVYFWYGKTCQLLKRPDETIWAYKNFLKYSDKKTSEYKEVQNELIELQNKFSSFTQNFEIGVQNFQKEEYHKALANFNKAIEMYSEGAKAYLWRAYTFSHVNEYIKSISDFENAIEADPINPVIYFEKSKVHRKIYQLDLAIQELDKSIAINPNYADAFFERGICFFELKKYENSIKDFEVAATLSPKKFHLLYLDWLKRIYEVKEDYKKAISTLKRYIRSLPKDFMNEHDKYLLYKKEYNRIKN